VPGAAELLSALPESAKCWKCGYALRGLAEPRCPECGTAFDAHAVLASTRRPGPRPVTKSVRRMLRPPGKMSFIVLSAIVLVGSSGCSLLYIGMTLPPLWIILPSLALALLTLVDVIRWPILMRRYAIPHELREPHWFRRSALLGLTGLGLLLWWLHVPLLVRFWISKPSLNHTARQLLAGSRDLPDQRIGLYQAVEIRRTANGFIFRLAGADSPATGLVYNPSGDFPACVQQRVYLGDGWYAFCNYSGWFYDPNDWSLFPVIYR